MIIRSLEINIEKERRRLQGVEGFFWGALGMIDNNFNFSSLPKQMVEQIKHQTEPVQMIKDDSSGDLFQKDVQLILKEGKLYYLPG